MFNYPMRSNIVFYLNGVRHSVGPDQAKMMLAEYLRYDQGLTGTKVVCAEGDCGACSVLRFFPANQNESGEKTYYPINSCISPVATMDGSSLITVEALKQDEDLHEAQRAMVECHGSQCGFCTPGFVIALAGLVEKKIENKSLTIEEQEAKNAMTGNLCRCTGYDAIIDAAKNIDLKKCQSLKDRYFSEDQEHDLLNISSTPVLLESDDYTFYAPTSLHAALECWEKHPDVRIIASATDLGVVHNKRRSKLDHLLSLHLIKELYETSIEDNSVKIGARVTMTQLRKFIQNTISEFARYLDIFASPQIKNIATVVGNIANASPIGDTPPTLLALGAKLHLTSKDGDREIALVDFYQDYKQTALRSEEIITAVSFEIPNKNFFKVFKNSNRKDLDISTVNFSMYIAEDKSEYRIAAGGVAAIPLRLRKTEDFLKGKSLDSQTIHQAIDILHTEFNPLSDVRASSAYRHMLVENYFKRAVSQYMEGQV
jgi:xanthine dehydrogenase small subunit